MSGARTGPHAQAATIAPGYTVIAHLSRGKRLDVYDVWSSERRCRCIAKTLRADIPAGGRPSRKLIREGRLLTRFTHPHIVRGYEVIHRPRPVVILETLSGETLGRLIERRTRRLSLNELCHLGLHLSAALAYLHAHRTLHLDLKPENVISSEGRAILIDLSIARRAGFARGRRGTPRYMPPEQFRSGVLTEAADVWGLGATLYTAAAGSGPFDPGATAPERRAAPLRSHRRMPREFCELVDACLALAPGERPPLEDVRSRLEALSSTEVERSARAGTPA